MVAETSMAV